MNVRPLAVLAAVVAVVVMPTTVVVAVSSTPPPDNTTTIDCRFRELALELSKRNLNLNTNVTGSEDKKKLAVVTNGLNLTQCPNVWPNDDGFDRVRVNDDEQEEEEEVVSIYASPVLGSDANDGLSLASPVKTLHKAKELVRNFTTAMEPPLPSQTIHVNLLDGGVFYESLTFEPRDSGVSSDAPVIWRSYPLNPQSPAVVSGGAMLDYCAWDSVVVNGNVTALRCAVKESDVPFASLFLDGQRLRRARFPNGDPDGTPCDSRGADACFGYVRAGPAGDTIGQCPANSVKLEGAQVTIVNGGLELSHGIVNVDEQQQATTFLNVSDTPYVHDAGAFVDYQAFGNGSGVACYDASRNKPFWNAGSCNCRDFSLISADGDDSMALRAQQWKSPTTGVVQMFHTDSWGGWSFNVSGAYDAGADSLPISGGHQTGQTGTGEINGNFFFVENVFEELDEAGEWYLDGTDNTLYIVPPAGWRKDDDLGVVHVALRPRVVEFRGSTTTGNDYVHDLALQNITIRHSAPTFLGYEYEIPSGGDWSVHRGGAVFLENTERINVTDNFIDQAGGNAVFLSDHTLSTEIVGNTVSRPGDSGIVLVGSTDLMNGTAPTYPSLSHIEGNLVHDVGYYGKQTAAVFQSITFRTWIANNVFFNSPRSLVNFNDAFRGGDLLEGNVLWGAVRETADHASFNSWDRQSWFWQEGGATYVRPENEIIRNNLILNKDYQFLTENSDWAIDHDDASSYFWDSENVMVYGAHKWRDGVEKHYVNNLYVSPPDAGTGAQQQGVGWYTPNTNASTFINNTFVNWGSERQFHYVWSAPFPESDFAVANNTYISPDGGAFNVAGAVTATSLEQWQEACRCDDGAIFSSGEVDVDDVIAQAREMLKLP